MRYSRNPTLHFVQGTLLPVLVAASFGTVFAAAQTAGTATPGAVKSELVYDAASIRPNPQGPGSTRVSINLDVCNATNLSLVELVREAYDLRPGMLFGQPEWAGTHRWDIHAKVLDASVEQLRSLTPEDRRRMMRVLLADRFHLVTHTESKALNVYELLQTKAGAKFLAIAPERRHDDFFGVSTGSMSVHNGHPVYHYVPLELLADFLSVQVNRPVLDKTALDAKYNLQLSRTRDDAPATEDATAPPLFKALEEQLGLRLAPARESVEVLVVDQVELPTEN